MRLLFPFTMVMLIVIIMMPFQVAAEGTYRWEEIVTIRPDDDLAYTGTFNGSLDNATDLSNYNATVLPFLDESGLEGTFTGGYLPPIVGKLSDNTRFEDTSISSVCEFKSEWVMSGSSRSWWRVPALNLTDFTNIIFTIWHLGNPAALTLTFNATTTMWAPNEGSQPQMVYLDAYASGSGENQTYRYQNISAWDYDFNLTWLRVDAPIHSDQHYYAQFCITTPVNNDLLGQRVLYSQSDIGDDKFYRTWTYQGSEAIYGADLDISVLHEYGMGHTVTGWKAAYGEVYYYDGFDGEDGTPADEYSDDITVTTAGTSVCTIFTPTKLFGNASLWTNYDGSNSCQVDLDMYDMVDFTRFEIYLRADQTDTYLWMEWEESDVIMIQITMSNAGQIEFKYGNGAGGVNTVASAYAADTWYKLWVDVSLTDDTYRGWVDEVMKEGPNADADGYDNFYNDRTATVIDVFHWGESANAGQFWMDDLSVIDIAPPNIDFNSHIEDGPDDVSDFVTFYMPFMFDITNASNVKVLIESTNHTWSETFWVAEDGPTDFIIKSIAWPHDWLCQDFHIRMWFYNQSQWFFVHDQNSEFDLTYDDGGPPGLETKWNMFLVYNHEGVPDGTLIWFRPFHALQRSDGAWTNTHIDPEYYLDGRLINASLLRMRNEQHSDPVAFKILRGVLTFIYYAYNMVDKIAFQDILPDWDAEPDFSYINSPAADLGLLIMFGFGIYFIEAVTIILKYAPMVLTFIAKGLTLFISFLVFINLIIVLNSVKRFFVVWAADGPLVGGQYAEHLIGNAYKRTFNTAAAIATKGRSLARPRQTARGKWGEYKHRIRHQPNLRRKFKKRWSSGKARWRKT